MINKYFWACVDLLRKERNTIILILLQGSLVYLAKRRTILKAVAVFFLLSMEEQLTNLVPTDGVHLTKFTWEIGLTAVRNKSYKFSNIKFNK